MNAFVIAGTHSGVGKTTVAIGLMAEFTRRGFPVQAFKIGPDYIDPSYHALATGRPSRNLDTWLCSKKVVRNLFARAALEVNVIEGVMGLFDGAKGGSGSTAEVARTVGLPIILVVDAQGMAQSIGALVHGFATYSEPTRLAGIIFNRVGSEGHYEYLRKAVKIPSLGWIEKNDALSLPERHLGLVPAKEQKPNIEKIRQAVVRHLDLEGLLRTTQIAPPRNPTKKSVRKKRVRIAYALDEAFSFYYQDNLDLLAAAGAELIPFSLLKDLKPPEVDLLYLGGGFPEIFQDRLLANSAMCTAIAAWEKPIYAECGGLIYLALVGKIPGKIQMTDHLQNFGYTEMTALVDTPLLRAGETVRGHEFHYSTWDGPANAYQVKQGGRSRVEGYADGRIMASYIHVHFASKPILARRLVMAAREEKRSG